MIRPVLAIITDAAGSVTYSHSPLRALEKTFHYFKTPLETSQLIEGMGLPKPLHIAKICQKHAPNLLPSEVVPVFNEHLSYELNKHWALFPRVASCLRKQQENGVKIGIWSGYERTHLQILLNKWASYAGVVFDASVSGDEMSEPRPSPSTIHQMLYRWHISPCYSLIIGDTQYDMEAANRAGAYSVGITGQSILGESAERLLQESKARKIVKSWKCIEDLLTAPRM